MDNGGSHQCAVLGLTRACNVCLQNHWILQVRLKQREFPDQTVQSTQAELDLCCEHKGPFSRISIIYEQIRGPNTPGRFSAILYLGDYFWNFPANQV